MNIEHLGSSFNPSAQEISVLLLTKDNAGWEQYAKVLPEDIAQQLRQGMDRGKPFCDGIITFLNFQEKLYGKIISFVLYGLGCEDITLNKIRIAFSKVGRDLLKRNFKRVSFFMPTFSSLGSSEVYEEALVALMVGTFDMGIYKTKKENNHDDEQECESKEFDAIKLYSATIGQEVANSIIDRSKKIAGAVNFAREINAQPANVVNPSFLAQKALDLAAEFGDCLSAKVIDEEEMRKQDMGGMLAVSSGSHQPPKFIVLTYRSNNFGKSVAVVGKAVTFDSGGISLKPAKDMEKMKYDKSGGVAVLGLIRAACLLKLPVSLYGIIPSVENLPGGKAIRPGDIITMRSGKTVEVINTDAEGRLILADGLDYASGLPCDLIIDLATLTGACVIALGHFASGLIGWCESAYLEAIKKAGEKTGERVWQLPLWDEYKESLKSVFADLKNVGDGTAGTITAASFLKEFVKNKPWMHLDIAGTAWNDKELGFLPIGPTGTPIRLLLAFLDEFRYSSKDS